MIVTCIFLDFHSTKIIRTAILILDSSSGSGGNTVYNGCGTALIQMLNFT